MPLYTFKNDETDEVTEIMMKISELDDFKAVNPHLKQLITGAPAIGDSARLGVKKTPDSFNSLLKHVKKGNSKGITKSTINTR
jgi:hypothetical protein